MGQRGETEKGPFIPQGRRNGKNICVSRRKTISPKGRGKRKFLRRSGGGHGPFQWGLKKRDESDMLLAVDERKIIILGEGGGQAARRSGRDERVFVIEKRNREED